jgi:hypothetical protein
MITGPFSLAYSLSLSSSSSSKIIMAMGISDESDITENKVGLVLYMT